ncbi:probable salivary secreted peptide [Neodiprion virginianus]|uniref:probable salivary secreted peptide n=1 Tax=Neodiprion virginianus TaxID=2961670 RepID=UPI001EE7390C|nr:probable salivary secreted peptide [Neodiprion virginianus]
MLTKASFALIFAVGLVATTGVSFGPNVLPLAYQGKALPANASHHLIVGTRLFADRLLSQQVVRKSSSWLQIVTKEVTFHTLNRENITQVKALDQKTNGNGAYASITYGGPGNRNVTLRFKSQRGHGINFVVEIYGR